MPETSSTGQSYAELRRDIANLMLEIVRGDPVGLDDVTDDTLCVGGELLQDSLDVLEFAVALERDFGVTIRDAEVGRAVLNDLGTVTRYVAKHRT